MIAKRETHYYYYYNFTKVPLDRFTDNFIKFSESARLLGLFPADLLSYQCWQVPLSISNYIDGKFHIYPELFLIMY